MADVTSFSIKTRRVTERAFTDAERAYRVAREAEWPERQKEGELRELEAKAKEALRTRELEAAKDDPDAPDAVKDYWAAREPKQVAEPTVRTR